jgi:hypothetical protein
VVEATLKCYNDVAYSFSPLQTPSVWAKEKEECSDEYLEPLKMMRSFGRGELLKWFLWHRDVDLAFVFGGLNNLSWTSTNNGDDVTRLFVTTTERETDGFLKLDKAHYAQSALTLKETFLDYSVHREDRRHCRNIVFISKFIRESYAETH